MKRVIVAVCLVLASCSSGGKAVTPLSSVYDCPDGTRLVLLDDAGAWLHEQADGTDIARGTIADRPAALKACGR